MLQRSPKILLAGVLVTWFGCSGGTSGDRTKGQTDFTNEETGGGKNGALPPSAGAPGAGDSRTATPTAPPAPGGRNATVEEADIYRIDGDRLFYLNTYRGFLIYDVRDPKKPARVGRLPIFGYPVEMFVDGTTVYALLREALYLSEKSGKLQFERHNVSQLISIDVSDPANPKVLKTIDIVGELAEGVSRKIEKSIYVVSNIPQWYYWGWRAPNQQPTKEQAWVYSFDVTDPRNTKEVGRLQIFEGGSVNFYDQKTGQSYNRNFNGVTISATSNALMVVENWSVYASSGNTGGGCGSFNSDQQAIVSIIDVSNPSGAIRRHTHFETTGELGDQFKQTYVNNPATGTGTYYGIFARRAWSGTGCTGRSEVRNTIESWDVTNGNAPVRLSTLAFGKPDETVRGSAFDTDRQVAYAITARNIDPLYAISLADRNNLKVLSAIDGLSGDMSVFRLIGDRKFLIGIGRDGTNTCQGFQTPGTMGPGVNQVAVSIIDVRDLARIRLVQRQCVAIDNAVWSGSAVQWDLDQAHKMIGMHSDGNVNVLTVPVYYYTKADNSDWWWYRYQTAVGLMSWDLTRYDDTKSERDQTVIQNFGTFVHPEGEVRRSIVFTHQATGQRMMINLSDTHVSVANLQNLAAPKLESIIPVAPYYNQLYRFGDYVVEEVQTRSSFGNPSDGLSEFRVKRAGGDLDGVTPVATFAVGQVQSVVKHKDQLVLFRMTQNAKVQGGVYVPPTTVALVYDLSDPTHPVRGGEATLPQQVMPYYRFWCGWGGYWGSFWFDDSSSTWVDTDGAIVFITQDWSTKDPTVQLVSLDLRNPRAPKVGQTPVSLGAGFELHGLVADPVDPRGFYLSYRLRTGETRVGDATFTRYRSYGQRWQPQGDGWTSQATFSLPGRLARTFTSQGRRLFLAQDYTYRQVTSNGSTYWTPDLRLHLLGELTVAGNAVAELLDTHRFTGIYPGGLVLDGDRLFVSASPQTFYGVGDVAPPGVGGAPAVRAQTETPTDRLQIFDLSQHTLRSVYDQPTGSYGLQLMGTYQGRLFVNLQGDGVLVVDVDNPAKPRGLRFLRTLGYASHIEFAGNDGYVASGYFGVYHLDLDGAPEIPTN
jgi:hypothetical protein